MLLFASLTGDAASRQVGSVSALSFYQMMLANAKYTAVRDCMRYSLLSADKVAVITHSHYLTHET